MQVLPQDIKIDEKALDYATAFLPVHECLRQYMAVILSYPLPGDLLEKFAHSHPVTIEDAHGIICDYIRAMFLRPEAVQQSGCSARA